MNYVAPNPAQDTPEINYFSVILNSKDQLASKILIPAAIHSTIYWMLTVEFADCLTDKCCLV